MPAHRLEEVPLQFQIQTKVNEYDYMTLIQRTRIESVSQSALIRDAVRQYLIQLNEITPTTSI